MGAASNLGTILACHLRILWAGYIFTFQEVTTQPRRTRMMTYTKILSASMTAFKQNFMAFCKNNADQCRTLDDHALTVLTNALMNAARAAGQAGLSQYLRSQDVLRPEMRYKEIDYRYKGLCRKNYLTLFGEISIERSIYGNEGDDGGYYVPLDDLLGLKKDEYATLETREMILFAASSSTPSDVASLLGKASLCRPSRTAIQNIIENDGRCMEENRSVIAERVVAMQQIPQSAHVMVASLDGANVLLRETGEKKGRKRLRPGEQVIAVESPSSYRNAMIGAFSFYDRGADGYAHRIASTYSARMPEEKSETFKKDFERIIDDYNGKIASHSTALSKILLCDGHRAIWNFAQDCKPLADYECLIDFYHSTEHLSRAAEAMYGQGSKKAQWWYWKWRNALKNESSAPISILRSMQGALERYRLSKTRRNELKTEITFFKRNKKLMRYTEFLKNGWPIGSGPVEAAAKVIVKQRMCRSGMRWSREKGQHILTLRAYVKSGQWDQMWNTYVEIRKAA
jgi:hypothetical protein